jgi:hypothetical protein
MRGWEGKGEGGKGWRIDRDGRELRMVIEGYIRDEGRGWCRG